MNADAVRAVDRMGAYLRTLPSFQVKSEFAQDDVLDDGQRISFGGTVDMVVQKPNHMRAEIMTDKQQRLYLYDGTSFTLFARRMNVYATVAAPKTLGALADELADRYDLEFPLSDLFYWGERKTDPFLSAIEVGPSQVGGTTCVHYAFRQEGVDWQVWIQQGEFPLPRKLIVTTTSDETRPQYNSVLTWNLAPSFNAAAFTFTPPKDAQRIIMRRVGDDGAGK